MLNTGAVPINLFLKRSDTPGGPFVVTMRGCSGSEEFLIYCSRYFRLKLDYVFQSPLLFSRSNPVAVSCQNIGSEYGHSYCNHGDLRLGNSTETSTKLEGRVEACVEGVWVVFCGLQQWGRHETATVCRQLLGEQVSGEFI